MKQELVTIRTQSYSASHNSGITTTTVAAVKDRTGNTRELYVLLDTGCSSGILSINYLNYVKILRNLSPTIVLQVAPIKLVGWLQ